MRYSVNGKLAIYFGSMVLPAMFIAGQLTGQIFKHYNPAGVDVNASLAYLRQSLVAALIAGSIMFGITLFFGLRGLRESDGKLAKIGLNIAFMQICAPLLVAVFQLLFTV